MALMQAARRKVSVSFVQLSSKPQKKALQTAVTGALGAWGVGSVMLQVG